MRRGTVFVRPTRAPLLALVALCLAAIPLACGSDAVPSPFGAGAGGAGGLAGTNGEAGFVLDTDAGVEADPTLGGPCDDDGQCDDAVACTQDRCDQELRRCRFEPDDSACGDDVYCDGNEICDVREGCREGEPIACSDDSTCTIDACVEATQACRHEPRDADADGDPTRNCGGTDCDDTNPLVSTGASERCGNGRDDDCDEQVDEAECKAPEHDTCKDALEVTGPGFYDLDLAASAFDYATPCTGADAGFRDVVVAVTVAEGAAQDVDIVAKLDSGEVSLGTAASCGAEETVVCEPSYVSPLGTGVSRLLLRGLAPGSYPIYVAATAETAVQLRVDFRAAEPPLPGELCEAGPLLIPAASPLLFRLTGYNSDFLSGCSGKTGDAFLRFSLEQASDVTLIAEAEDELGLPVLSLLDASCLKEITCRQSQPGRLFARGLPAGDYRVALSATGPADVAVRLELAPVSESPAGEGCAEPPTLVEGSEQVMDLSEHEDAVHPNCLIGAPDATFGFELNQPSDIALIGRLADGDLGSVSVATLNCAASLACSTGQGTVRTYAYGLGKGEHRAIIESRQGNPVGLSHFVRPAAPAVHVPFADDCESPVLVPELGGRFSGTTANAFPDFDAGCDVGGQAEGGAADQLLELRLSQPRRVILDMSGSSFDTLLSVRAGEACPGVELPLACAPGYRASRSFLDLDLQAGDYFVQIDGYNGDSGVWKLEVFTAPL